MLASVQIRTYSKYKRYLKQKDIEIMAIQHSMQRIDSILSKRSTVCNSKLDKCIKYTVA